jgi:glycosyltransferase involved in cell wall biosynthesis
MFYPVVAKISVYHAYDFGVSLLQMGRDSLNILLMLHRMRVDGSGIYYSRLAGKLKERGHHVIVLSAGGALENALAKRGVRHYKFPVLDNLNASWVMHAFELARSAKGRITNRPKMVNEASATFSGSTPEKLRLSKVVRFLARTVCFSVGWVLSVVAVCRIVKRNKIDIIEAHSTCAIALALCCRELSNVPFFANIANSNYMGLPTAMLKTVSKKASGVIAISEECVDYLNSTGEWSNRPEIIHNFVDLKRFRPYTEPGKKDCWSYLLNKGLDAEPENPTIVIVSRLDGDKADSVFETIRSMVWIHDAIPDAQLLVVGGGNVLKEASALAESINRKVGDKIVFMLGYETNVEKAMNVGSLVIGVGGVIVEAMACGKPVVVAGHVKGKLGGSFGGIVKPENLEAIRKYYFTGRNSSEVTSGRLIANACIELLSDERRRKSLGELSRRFAMENCNIDKSVARIEKLYSTSLNL